MTVTVVAFCCWFAYTPDDIIISGDWRDWGFESDPIVPQPTDELELV
jgi:hypothetical protein